MKKIILTLAMTALTLAFAPQTQAAPKSGGTGQAKVSSSRSGTNNNVHVTNNKVTNVHKSDPGRFRDYHLTHGTRFDHGFFYRGKNHDHWGLTRFDPRYGCTCYWDPCLSVWYYWCQRDICYYPVSYCPYRCYTCPPVVEVVRPVCQTCRPVPTCTTCTSVQVSLQTSTAAPPINNIPAIPEPVSPRR